MAQMSSPQSGQRTETEGTLSKQEDTPLGLGVHQTHDPSSADWQEPLDVLEEEEEENHDDQGFHIGWQSKSHVLKRTQQNGLYVFAL